MFHSCAEYILTSAIQWCHYIFHIPQTMSIESSKNWFSTIEIEVKVPAIRLGTCSKCSTLDPITTRRALSNGVIRFSIGQTIVPKKLKHCNFISKFQQQIRIISPRIRLGTCYRCSNAVSSTTRWALSNGVISCSETQTKNFRVTCGATFGPKNKDWAFEKLITPFDRARRVVFGTRAEHWEHVPGRIRGENTWIRWQLHLCCFLSGIFPCCWFSH